MRLGRELEGPGGFPAYEVIIANGRAEVVEQRREEPVLYVTEDPAIRSALGVSQR